METSFFGSPKEVNTPHANPYLRQTEGGFGQTPRMQKTPISQILTDNLLKFMERQNMNQQRLAEKTGLSVSSVSEIVRGISSPKVSTLEAIASQLRVQAWELLVNDEEIRRRAIEHSLIPPPPTPERAEKQTVHSRKKRRVRAVNPTPDT